MDYYNHERRISEPLTGHCYCERDYNLTFVGSKRNTLLQIHHKPRPITLEETRRKGPAWGRARQAWGGHQHPFGENNVVSRCWQLLPTACCQCPWISLCGGEQKKIQDPLQASKNSHPLDCNNRFPDIPLRPFHCTLSFFAYRTGSAHLLQLKCCPSYRTTDSERTAYFEKLLFYKLSPEPEGKRPLGRPRRRWVDSIRMDLQEVGCGYMDWIGLAQDRDRWRTLVSAVMNLRVPWNAGNFLTSCKPVSFSGRNLHHGVSKYLQNLVSSSTNAKKFVYGTGNSPLMPTQLMFCTEQYDKTTYFGPGSRS